MSAAGYTPIQLFHSNTTGVVAAPTDLQVAELFLNTTDGTLYYKDNSSVVKLLASNSGTSGVFTSVTDSGLTATQLVFAGVGGLLSGNAGLTWDGANLSISGDTILNSTGAITMPVGTTAQEPVTPTTGMLRFNSTLGQFEGYNGSSWTQIGGGATGGGRDQVFVENQTVVTVSYTLPTGFNAESVGPVSINSGITVTIPSNQRWVIL